MQQLWGGDRKIMAAAFRQAPANKVGETCPYCFGGSHRYKSGHRCWCPRGQSGRGSQF